MDVAGASDLHMHDEPLRIACLKLPSVTHRCPVFGAIYESPYGKFIDNEKKAEGPPTTYILGGQLC